MKKTLIALTLASLSVTASADVILYGKIRGGVETSRIFTKSIENKGTSTKIVDYSSVLGFKGHEDLSNNLRAIWQVEQNVSIGGNTSTAFGNRDSFIGLSGGFGTVKAGHLSTPTKDVNSRLDQWEYSDSAAGLGIYTRTNKAVNRKAAVSYETPNFGGFTAQAYVSPSDNNNGNKVLFANNNKEPEAAIYGAKMGYENAGFFADVAGTYVKNSKTVGNKTHDGYQASANVGFQNENWLAGVGYQQARYVDDIATITGQDADELKEFLDLPKDTPVETIKGSKEVAASAAYTVNNALRLKGSAAYGFDINDTTVGLYNKGKYVQGIVGADYLLSKRTTLNGQVGYLEIKPNKDAQKAKKGTVGVGMVHKF